MLPEQERWSRVKLATAVAGSPAPGGSWSWDRRASVGAVVQPARSLIPACHLTERRSWAKSRVGGGEPWVCRKRAGPGKDSTGFTKVSFISRDLDAVSLKTFDSYLGRDEPSGFLVGRLSRSKQGLSHGPISLFCISSPFCARGGRGSPGSLGRAGLPRDHRFVE